MGGARRFGRRPASRARPAPCRNLWGTDWTRAFAVVNYEQAVEPFLKAVGIGSPEERFGFAVVLAEIAVGLAGKHPRFRSSSAAC